MLHYTAELNMDFGGMGSVNFPVAGPRLLLSAAPLSHVSDVCGVGV